MAQKNYTYLALGDSYTVGEGVQESQNFPNQTAGILKQQGFAFSTPTIVATTGWTTSELLQGIAACTLSEIYDIVSLLIGVNNQYRGRDMEEYEREFGILLSKSIEFASNKPSNVFILSIPDWSVTPYAEGRDRAKISKEIEEFNSINKKVSQMRKVNYIEVTEGSKQAANDRLLVAPDGLHPSATEYRRWAESLAAAIRKQLR